ncbi:MAG: peptidylprolyl isomerase [Proteobacteria bacterium]|nr:peptidylprolyl isomerase [Pseudomonadota bacterium]
MSARRSAALAAAALLLATPAFAAPDPVVARVNGYEIHKSDVNRELSGLPPQLQQMPVESIYPQLLERMIDSKLVADEGRAQKIDQGDEFKERLKHTEERILTDITLRSKVKPMLTEDKIRGRYDAVMSKSKNEEEVKARHILVKTEAEAKDVIAQLGKGGDFAKLAAEKSTDKGSAANGGDLGYFSKSSMVPAFADAAFAMKPGEVSKTPVKTDFGYHVIKVEDRRTAPPVSYDKVKPQIEAQVADELANEYVSGLEKKAKIERFNLDGSPMKVEVSAPAGAVPASAPASAPAKPAEKK